MDHLHHEVAFQRFAEEQELSEQRLAPPPTWMNAHQRQQQNFMHLQPEKSVDRSSGGEELAEYKADILGHPLYDQLLSAHVSCLRIATPVDQLPRIDAQLQQAQRVVDKCSRLGNGVVDEKELDQFMVCFFLCFSQYIIIIIIIF